MGARQPHTPRAVQLHAGGALWPFRLAHGAAGGPLPAPRARGSLGGRAGGAPVPGRDAAEDGACSGLGGAACRRGPRPPPLGHASGRTHHARGALWPVMGLPTWKGLRCPRRGVGRGAGRRRGHVSPGPTCAPLAVAGGVGPPTPHGPHRPCAQAVPPPWPLDEPSAWGVPCRTVFGQEVVEAAVGVVACMDQSAPWGGPPAWAWGTRRS